MTGTAPVVRVVDDDESVRAGLRRLLGSVGLAVETFPSAQALLDADVAHAPGCLVLDVQLPGLSGLELQRRLKAAGLTPPIVFLTAHGDIPMSVRAIKAGALEFLTKPFRPDELLAAVHEALARDRDAREAADQLSELRRRHATLSARECEVMAGVVAGRLNKQIAADFGTRESTVKEQRAQVMQKMQAASVADLVRFAGRLADARPRPPAATSAPDPGDPRSDPPERGLIALIDDDTSLRRSVGNYLRSLGFAVETFASADELLAEPSRHSPARAIVLDLRMPGLGGLELLAQLAARDHRTPVVVLTADNDRAVHDRCLALGAAAVITKPLHVSTLLRALTDALTATR